MNYDTIKALAKERGCRVTDLIALAPQNDPFYVGAESTHQGAESFADLYGLFGYGYGVHLQRVHYRLISQDLPTRMPNGKPYANTDNCWKYLGQASTWARYVHLVNADEFDDGEAKPAWIDTSHRSAHGAARHSQAPALIKLGLVMSTEPCSSCQPLDTHQTVSSAGATRPAPHRLPDCW